MLEGVQVAFLEFVSEKLSRYHVPHSGVLLLGFLAGACMSMNDCLNITAKEVSKADKRCPEMKVFSTQRIKLVPPFMIITGFRHRNRATEIDIKGERCFHLNSGISHSPTCKSSSRQQAL